MRYTNLSESDEYRAAREALRLEELDLVGHVERVAALRRALPLGPVVDDYELLEDGDEGGGAARVVPLSSLFGGHERALLVYHLMYGKRQTTPCPMCTMWVDGLNGVARHLRANADLAIVAAAPPDQLHAYARDRGWHDVRLLSAGSSAFKRDLGSEDEDGNQESRISVFTLDPHGTVRHHYTGAPSFSEVQRERGIDLLCATWNLLDLTPAGRGDWYASLFYDEQSR